MADSPMSRAQVGPGHSWAGGSRVPSEMQRPLFYKRVSTPLPAQPNGKDIGFRCFADDGGLYYCKDDKDGRPIRANEWIATRLASHLGLSVCEMAIIEDDSGTTYFGSKSPNSLANSTEVTRYLGTPQTGELGQPLPWLGQYLARLFAFDMFIDNPDRSLVNFILDSDGSPRRLRAIDFASARLIPLSEDRFPIESDPTVWVGRVVRKMHGSHLDSALELLDQIAAVRIQTIESFVKQMPDDWLSQCRKEGLSGSWSDSHRHRRIARLRAWLKNESKI